MGRRGLGGLCKNLVCDVLRGLWECVKHYEILGKRTEGGEREDQGGLGQGGLEKAWGNRRKRG